MVRAITPSSLSMSATLNATRTVVIQDVVLDLPQNGFYFKAIYPDYGAFDVFIPTALFPNKDLTVIEAGDNLSEQLGAILNTTAPETISGKFSRGTIGNKTLTVLVVTTV